MKIKSNKEYYFIKPFEIVSSYLAFIDTWKIVNKISSNIDEVSDVKLMQSNFNDFKFGFISFSNWETKESYIRSNLMNTVFSYHNLESGNNSKSVTQYLYKLISEENYNLGINNPEAVEILVFENLTSKELDISGFWDELIETYLQKHKIQSAALYKAVYKKSKFSYIGFIYPVIAAKPNLQERSCDIFSDKEYPGFKIHSSTFNTILKLKRVKTI
ncbi:MAG: hypothetical protein ACOYN6_03250 [Ignavibacteria bacterium]